MPRRSKVTFRLNILFNFTVYNIKYTVAEALPPPEAVSDPPAFLVGAHVHVKPDTRPGIGPENIICFDVMFLLCGLCVVGAAEYIFIFVRNFSHDAYSHHSFYFPTALFPLPVICCWLFKRSKLLLLRIPQLFLSLFV